MEENNNNYENYNYDYENNSQTDQIKKLKKKNSFLKVSNIILLCFSIVSVLVFAILYINFGMYFRILLNRNTDKEKMIEEHETTETISTTSELGKNSSLDVEYFKGKLELVDDYITNFFYYDKDNQKIQDEMLTGYVNALNDKYAEYLPAKTYDEFLETQSGEYYGIGAAITKDLETGESTIVEVYEGSPAEEAGVMVDDIVKTVDGKDVSNAELNDIVSLIKGEEGTSVLVGFYRPSLDKIIELNCVRGKVEVKRVILEMKEDNIAYLRLTEFTGKSLSQFKDALNSLIENNSKGVVIDLRNDPGGELDIVLDMLDYMLKDDNGKYTLNQIKNEFTIGRTLLVYMKDKTSIVDAYYCDDNHDFNIPIVILTNESSASASELFTETLRDYDMATIVGHKTYGKGVMQNLMPLGDGSAIKFTVAGYFPPSGYDINNFGILPDYSIDIDGEKINYDDKGNMITKNDNGELVLVSNNKIVKIATNSELLNNYNKTKKYNEDLDISSDNFIYKDEDWFKEMDSIYEDKQLLQAMILLK